MNDAVHRVSPAGRSALSRLNAFWQQVSDGQGVSDLWRQFEAEARASYRLYSREVDFKSLEGHKAGPRAARIARSLFWAMLMKLSPPRRVFLILALALNLFALSGIQPYGWPREIFILAGALSLLALIALELADRVVMKRDLEIARDIQRWLVPAAAPQVPGFDIAFATRPANTVSGDYYDAYLRSVSGETAQCLQLVVADVAGKSVPAALLMATFQASLRTLGEALPSLTAMVAGLNRYACAHSLGGRRFTTAFLADIDKTSGGVSFVNAGHNAPVLRRASGEIERLEAGGVPLGILAQAKHDCGATSLNSGDVLVVYTDGVVEAENTAEEEFGEARLLALCRAAGGRPAAEVVASVMTALDRFAAGAPQHDDMTCLVVRRL